jgi:hypothetical protein
VRSKRVAYEHDGERLIRFVIRFANENTSVFLGRFKLDLRGGPGSDATIEFSHWDNGVSPNSCAVHDHGTETVVHPRFMGDGFACVVPRDLLRCDHPPRWIAIVSDDFSHGDPDDRAPDTGWYP